MRETVFHRAHTSTTSTQTTERAGRQGPARLSCRSAKLRALCDKGGRRRSSLWVTGRFFDTRSGMMRLKSSCCVPLICSALHEPRISSILWWGTSVDRTTSVQAASASSRSSCRERQLLPPRRRQSFLVKLLRQEIAAPGRAPGFDAGDCMPNPHSTSSAFPRSLLSFMCSERTSASLFTEGLIGHAAARQQPRPARPQLDCRLLARPQCCSPRRSALDEGNVNKVESSQSLRGRHQSSPDGHGC